MNLHRSRLATLGGIALALSVGLAVAPANATAQRASGDQPGSSWTTSSETGAGARLAAGSTATPTGTSATAALRRAKALFNGTLVRQQRADARLAQGKATPSRGIDATMILRDLYLARPAMTPAQRAQADRILARPTDFGGDKVLCDPTCHFFTLTNEAPPIDNAHFRIHYTQFGPNAATPQQAQLTADTMLAVYNAEVGRMGFNAPRSDGTLGGGSGLIDVYLGNLGGLSPVNPIYGYCASDPHGASTTKTSAYCALDNNFDPSKFDPQGQNPTPPIGSLRVTAAHEFFHAIQFGYNIRQPRWFMEGSAVWMEDEVYPTINDYYQYLPSSPIMIPSLPFTYNGIYTVYGDFALYKFLQAKFHDKSFVKKMWNQVGNNGVGALTALKRVLKQHHSSLAKAMPVFGVWNTLPRGSYPDRNSWLGFLIGHRSGIGVWKVGKLKVGTRSRWLSPKVYPLATAPLVVLPIGKQSRARAVITVKAPKSGAVWVQFRMKNGKTKKIRFGLNKRGQGTHSYGFKPKKTGAIIITMTNTADHGAKKRFKTQITLRK